MGDTGAVGRHRILMVDSIQIRFSTNSISKQVRSSASWQGHVLEHWRSQGAQPPRHNLAALLSSASLAIGNHEEKGLHTTNTQTTCLMPNLYCIEAKTNSS